MDDARTAPDASQIAREDAFAARVRGRDIAPLWVGRRGVDLTRPRSPAVAACWPYAEMRPDLIEAGALVAAEDAFRRVLVLENPAFPGEMRVTNTLYAGLQLVLPGEIAPCHRHSQTALRFVVEGVSAYTSVDGERTRLHPGDFVVTPQWSWHDHGNDGTEGSGPVMWLDVLDTPLVGFLDTVFRENFPEPVHPVTRAEGTAPALYGSNMLPFGAQRAPGASPVFSYPYTASRPALAALAQAGVPDPCHGFRMEYVNPMTGGAATPTIGAFLQLLPAGFAGKDYRSTDGAVFCVAEGSGSIHVDDGKIRWTKGDAFSVPGWHTYRLEADGDAVLFSASDRPVQRVLGLWREERG
jgi:gentisate 1,2-dioxygenase